MYFVRLIKPPSKRAVSLPLCGRPPEVIPGGSQAQGDAEARSVCSQHVVLRFLSSGAAPWTVGSAVQPAQISLWNCIGYQGQAAESVSAQNQLVCLSLWAAGFRALGQFARGTLNMGVLSPVYSQSSALLRLSKQKCPEWGELEIPVQRWESLVISALRRRCWGRWIWGLVPPIPITLYGDRVCQCMFTKSEFRILLCTGFWASNKETLLVNNRRI